MSATGDKTVEIVLPCGTFARIGHVTYRDFIETSPGEPSLFAARVVTLDGKPVTVEQILQMDIDDASAVVGLANGRLARALSTIKGVS